MNDTKSGSRLACGDLEHYGNELFVARVERTAVAPLTERVAGLGIQDAYRIQLHTIERRISAGERVIGKKIGVTNKLVMEVHKLGQPDFGHLTSDMVYNDGCAIEAASLIAPQAGGELAFVLCRDITGPGVTETDVLSATDYVLPCVEIIDSRIRDWKIKIEDTVADNASSGVFVLGDTAVDPRTLDLKTVGMTLEKNGEIVATGAGAAALGNPLTAVAWLANTLGALGTSLKAGEVILSGSLAAMVPVQAGDNLRMSLGGVGSATARII